MKLRSYICNLKTFSFLIFFIVLNGCTSNGMRSIYRLNDSLFQSASSYREPALGQQWLVTLANHQGREKIELLDLRRRRKVALPGINRADSQPISVSVSANGERLAFIRQRGDQTELLLYRRNIGTVQRLQITPKGVPRRVSLDGAGRILAVQVSRDGRWDVDILRIQG